MYRKYEYNPTITSLFRDQDEQDDIYKDNPDYQKTPWYSVHQFGRGLDFRSIDMSKEMHEETLTFFKQIVYSGGKETLIRHSVKGDHFHLQVDKDAITEIKKL